MNRTWDPVADAETWIQEQEEWLASRPKCDCCHEPIQTDFYFDADGDTLCEECFHDWCRDNFLRFLED